jgi:hypothetical protein
MEENLPMVQKRSFGIIPRGIDETIKLAKIMSSSGLMPKCIQTPEAVFVAMQMGAEIGLSPMASVQNIAVINGRPGIYGDAVMAVVRASGLLEEIKEWAEGERKTTAWTFYCRIKRKGFEVATGSFSWAEACEAGFDRADTSSPWKKWTNRLMQFKARNFVMRDQFADILKGIRTVEENSDAIDLEPTAGNDGRQQYQVKTSAETELSGSGSIDENAFDLLAAEQYPDGEQKLLEFVLLTASANGVSVEDLKNRAVGNWDDFIKAYELWRVKNQIPKKEVRAGSEPAPTNPPETQQAEEKPGDQWADFRQKFINLRGSGYSTFVFQNLDRFKQCPKEIQNEAIEKWVKYYAGQPWPLNAHKTPVEYQQPQSAASTAKPMSDILVSYSQEYKDLMQLKSEFHDLYLQAKANLAIVPDTVDNCTKIHAAMSVMVRAGLERAGLEPAPTDLIPDGADPDEFDKF